MKILFKAIWITIIVCITLFALLIILDPLLSCPQHNIISANETSAIVALKDIIKAEMIWHTKDFDGNGISDFWTYDLSCLYRIKSSETSAESDLIDIATAKADAHPAPIGFFGSTPLLTQIENDKFIPKRGYYFQAMLIDETGKPYNQNIVGANKIQAANSSRFAFVAYPAVYGKTGKRTFITDESGMIYWKDTESDTNKIILDWPNKRQFQDRNDYTESKLWRIEE